MQNEMNQGHKTKSLFLNRVANLNSPQASSLGHSAWGGGGERGEKGELTTMSREFEFLHLQSLCGSLSTELSDFHQSARIGAEMSENINKR